MNANKIKTVAIAVALLFASFTLMTNFQAVTSQLTHSGASPIGMVGDPNLHPLPTGVTPAYSFDTVAYLSFRPNPIGVGQSLLINVWSSPGMYHCFYMTEYKVTIEKPDGSTVVLGPVNSYLGDATAWFEYVPDTPGTWRFKFEHPGTYVPPGVYRDRPGTASLTNYTLYASVWYKPSSTDWQELTVQSDMVASWPPSPLPTDYWTRPANAVHREWYSILGSYPWTGVYYYAGGRVLYSSNYRYTAYVQAPNSAHIVWKRQGALSGMLGGDSYIYSMGSTPSTPSVIFAGRCYQTYSKPGSGSTAVTYWVCYDLRTGEVYWERPLATGENAPIAVELNPPTGVSTVAGAVATEGWSVSLVYVGGSLLQKYNPWTGARTLNVSTAPVTTGSQFPMYNNEWVLSLQSQGGGKYRLINWTTRGTTTNFTARIGSNISWPIGNLGTDAGRKIVDYEAGVSAQFLWATPPGSDWCIGHNITAVDLYTGAVLWESSTNNTLAENMQNPGSPIADRGKLAIATHGRHWSCWNSRTGQKLWESEQTPYPWGAWYPYSAASYDFNESKGAIITSTYEGVYAIDWDDGKLLWECHDPNPVPFEGPYDATPFFTAVTIADGKVYAFNGEHSASLPRDRAWKLHCINATTGELIWKILNPMEPGAVADGYLTAGNPYDGYMYVFGKGKSATTTTAPKTVISLGTGLVIEGTVLDQSSAQPGTPCVSKDSMETQMEYLHLQMPIDGLWHNESIAGVPVTLTAIKSDGTVLDLGTVTTNGYYGTFNYVWTPQSEGTYEIVASFAGDDSYGSSSAATAISVGPAPTTPEQPEIPTPIDYTMTILYAAIGITIAVAIVGLLIFLGLRKR